VNRQEKHLEEERRERHWDPRRCWLAICETLTWAEAQATVARNTAGSCLAKQEILNAANAGVNLDVIRIVQVKPLEGHRLWVRFNDGLEGVYAVEPERRGGVFQTLVDPALFKAVSLNEDFGCVEWPGGADLCPTSMHEELFAAEEQHNQVTEAMLVRETPPAKERKRHE
jgi:hypothetical protein